VLHFFAPLGGLASAAVVVAGDAVGSLASAALILQFEAIGVVDDAVQDGVTESGLANDLMPGSKGELAGDQQRAASMTILDDLHQIAPLAG
jgi:hypothetical protein